MPNASPAQHRRYVVGVDGSETSVKALVWALDRAADTGAQVVAVAMWHYPPVGIETPAAGRKIHAATSEMLEEAVAAAKKRRGNDDVKLTSEVYQYPAADRLIDMSDDADLLVVGRRSHHALASLGSVSSRVAIHAHCPVVVIPADKAD